VSLLRRISGTAVGVVTNVVGVLQGLAKEGHRCPSSCRSPTTNSTPFTGGDLTLEEDDKETTKEEDDDHNK